VTVAHVQQEVVFKIYESVDAKQLYDREAAVYTRLRRINIMSITKCYGSLAYTNKGVIILEYAPKGSLLDLFKTQPPVDWKDLKRLWMSLLELFQGLYVLHNPDRSDSKSLSGYVYDALP
jgi:serine/threonine protein kinase